MHNFTKTQSNDCSLTKCTSRKQNYILTRINQPARNSYSSSSCTPAHHKKSGWQYLGYKERYQRSNKKSVSFKGFLGEFGGFFLFLRLLYFSNMVWLSSSLCLFSCSVKHAFLFKVAFLLQLSKDTPFFCEKLRCNIFCCERVDSAQ